MWNNLPYTVFDKGMLNGFKGAVNRWLLRRVVFSSVFHGAIYNLVSNYQVNVERYYYY